LKRLCILFVAAAVVLAARQVATAQAGGVETEIVRMECAVGLEEVETEIVSMAGPVTIALYPGTIQDGDGDGLEEIDTEIVQMELVGTSALLGPIRIRERSPSQPPMQPSKGKIEERQNNTPGGLDLPPFNPGGPADSFFDFFFELDTSQGLLHNTSPLKLAGGVAQWPPAPGETMVTPAGSPPTQLQDEFGSPSPVRANSMSCTVSQSVGGSLGLLDGPDEPAPAAGSGGSGVPYAALADAAARPAESGDADVPYVAIAGAAALALVAGGAWWTRRRWAC